MEQFIKDVVSTLATNYTSLCTILYYAVFIAYAYIIIDCNDFLNKRLLCVLCMLL